MIPSRLLTSAWYSGVSCAGAGGAISILADGTRCAFWQAREWNRFCERFSGLPQCSQFFACSPVACAVPLATGFTIVTIQQCIHLIQHVRRVVTRSVEP